MLKENARIVFKYLLDHDGENFTAIDIAEETGLNIKSVNGILTQAFQRHRDPVTREIVPLIERVPAELELTDEDGNVTHKPIKLIVLTDEGREFDPDETAPLENPEE